MNLVASLNQTDFLTFMEEAENVNATSTPIDSQSTNNQSALIFSVIIIPGIVIYIPVIWTLLKNRHIFNQPFYIVVYSLAVGDLGINLLYGLGYIVPCLLYGRVLGGNGFGTAVGLFEAVMFMVVAGSTFLMSLSRFGAVLFPIIGRPVLNQTIFGKGSMKKWVVGVWIHGIAIVGILIASGCDLVIAPSLLSPMYVCNSTVSSVTNAVVSGYVTVTVSVVLIAINVATLAILLFRQKFRPAASKNEKKSYRMELRFFMQSFVIYLGLFLNNGFFQLVSLLQMFSYQIFVLLGCFMFLNSALSPIIYIFFNPQVRNVMLNGMGYKVGVSTGVSGVSEAGSRVVPAKEPRRSLHPPLVVEPI